jgi:hypothetical protein
MPTHKKNPKIKEEEEKLIERAGPANSFSQLTYLLRLVTTLNFNDNLRSSFQRKGSAKDPEFTLLDSVAAILVQEHEVVAVCYTSDSKISVMASEMDAIPHTDVEVEVEVPPDTFRSIQLAALSNPEYHDELSNNRNPHKVQIQEEGESLWEKVRDADDRGWYCAFT